MKKKNINLNVEAAILSLIYALFNGVAKNMEFSNLQFITRKALQRKEN